MGLIRVAGWQKRLQEYLSQSKRLDFAWGEHDCALFTSRCIEAMTGVDLSAPFVPYETQQEGLDALQAAGFENHAAWVRHNLPETDRPSPGDVAVFEGGTGIVQGRYIYVLAEREQSLSYLPISRADGFLKVG